MTSDDVTPELSPVKRALLEIRQLRGKLAQFEEPIAVVGLGCRLPGGVRGPDEYWSLLVNGVDAVGPVPADRWDRDALYHPDPDRPGSMTTREGAFLSGVDLFDAEFFGIAPVEAATMDPQQRLLLETAWEALEHAGIPAASLRGSRTGVFLGVGNSDYWRMTFSDHAALDSYAATGGSYAVAAGRLSYFLGLNGPAVVVDTACSASLVAIHLAVQSLRSGESDLALAGGVSLILTPETHVAFSKAGMMAPDGRCKTFDEAANGYGRGEGVGVVVLRRLSDARARGEWPLAVIRGTAVNQDGRSGGLTVPSGPAQEAVIREALRSAGLGPADVDLVEAHGTGTPLGDPIELRALAAAYGEGRATDQPLLVGSVKTNLGHLEAAAGVAGFIKATLAVAHGVVPAHLHLRTPTSHVTWDRLPLRVPTSTEPWPSTNHPRRAAVSSFGFSGTNAHIVIEAAEPGSAEHPAAPEPVLVMPGSAKSPGALREVAAAWARTIERRPDEFPAVAAAAALGRSHLEHRVAVVGDAGRVARSLESWAAGVPTPSVASGIAVADPAPIAFLFTGQGPQHPGMGRDLFERSEAFRAKVTAIADLCGPDLGPRILGILAGDAGIDCHATELAQPAIFAFELGMVALWAEYNVRPTVVAGHSLGELAAAVTAGVLTLEDGVRLAVTRSRLLQSLPAGGGMAVVELSESAIAPLLAGVPEVEIAGINGPGQVTLAGPEAALDRVEAQVRARGLEWRRLRVAYASHSRAVDPMLESFRQGLSGIRAAEPAIRVVSSLTGTSADHAFGTADYWVRQVRQPVRFSDALRTVQSLGTGVLVEVGPHPVLLGLAAADPALADAVMIPSARRDEACWPLIADGIAQLYVRGYDIDWSAVYRRPTARPDLATYPFQRRRHWVSQARRSPSLAAAAVRTPAVVRAARRQAELAPIGFRPESVPALWEVLEELTRAVSLDTLAGLGAFPAGAGPATVDEILARTGIQPLYRHLVTRWLTRLSAAGLLTCSGDRFEPGPMPIARDAVAAAWRAALPLLAGEGPMARYLDRCVQLTRSVVTGKVSALETLFPGGDPEMAEALYRDSGVMRYVNLIAAAAIEAEVRHFDGRACRLLEVGAGTGGTTAAILPRLEPAPVEYWFTDVSDLFLGRAAERFGADHPNLRFARFDLDRDLAGQSFPPGSVDIIVATNAVHAVRDLGPALGRLHDLLVPGGLLVLVETTTDLAWFDISTGLIEGWQHFADALRGDHPLLTAAQWETALTTAGFDVAGATPDATDLTGAGGQQVIMARRPGNGGSAVAIAAPDAATRDADRGAEPEADETLATLLATPPALREDVLVDLVRAEVSRVLRLGPDTQPGRQDRLMDLGFDSLLAVKLRNRLTTRLALEHPLPVTLLFDHPTIEAIARFLNSLLAPPAPVTTTTGPVTEAQLASMSEADVERLLAERLGDWT